MSESSNRLLIINNTGELKELRESVNQLQQEVEAQRRKYKDLREKYELLVLKKAEVSNF